MLLISEMSKMIKYCSLMIAAGYFLYKMGILDPKVADLTIFSRIDVISIYAISFWSSGTAYSGTNALYTIFLG